MFYFTPQKSICQKYIVQYEQAKPFNARVCCAVAIFIYGGGQAT